MEKRLAELHMDMMRKDEKIRDLEKEIELLNYMNRMLTIRNHKLEDRFHKEIINLKDVVQRKENIIGRLKSRIKALRTTQEALKRRPDPMEDRSINTSEGTTFTLTLRKAEDE